MEKMNQRERYIRHLKFEKTDRIPDMELGVWGETIDRWHHEGLPWWVGNLFQLSDYLRLDKSFNCDWLPIHNGIYPDQEFHVVEDTTEWQIIEDSIGLKMKRSKQNASIPQYLHFPVEDRTDYEKLSPLLDPNEPGRYSRDFDEDLSHRTMRGEIRGIHFIGLLGFPREIMGLENYCMAIYDQPELVEQMLDDRVRMASEVYRRVLSVRGLDYVQIWEDMAYKAGPLVSPGFMESHMVERYKEICRVFREGGVRLIMMDCDGSIEKIMPIIEKSGIDGIYPCEIAAGSDPVELRKKYPGVALAGGVDKRVLAFEGKEGAKNELRRLQPIIQDGGYIPYIDHFIPPDISYDTFYYYVQLKSELMINPGMKIL
jgi:uroporphyrinogen decarboxylase